MYSWTRAWPFLFVFLKAKRFQMQVITWIRRQTFPIGFILWQNHPNYCKICITPLHIRRNLYTQAFYNQKKTLKVKTPLVLELGQYTAVASIVPPYSVRIGAPRICLPYKRPSTPPLLHISKKKHQHTVTQHRITQSIVTQHVPFISTRWRHSLPSLACCSVLLSLASLSLSLSLRILAIPPPNSLASSL